jgi:hypothetical protein
MTPKISLITAIVGAALVFAAPAFGDNWGTDRQDQAIVNAMAEDGFDRAVLAAKQNRLATMLNARERGLGVNQDKQTASTFDARSDGLNRLYGLGEYSNMLDARERALGVAKTTPQPQGYDARSDGLNRQYGLGEYASPVVADFDRFRIDHSNDPVTVSATSSGRDFEWPTIGIGFGIGIVFLMGLALALKATHTRPFAH